MGTLYRFFDKDGVLLYVGITSRGVERVREHAASKSWWDAVANATFEHFEKHDDLLEAERNAVFSGKPQHNINLVEETECRSGHHPRYASRPPCCHCGDEPAYSLKSGLCKPCSRVMSYKGKLPSVNLLERRRIRKIADQHST